jgi:hypothetical protein
MSSGFDAACRVTEFYAAFARVKELVADFRANENIPSPIRWEKVAAGRMRGNSNIVFGLDRQIDAPVYDLYALTPAKIKIVEGATH